MFNQIDSFYPQQQKSRWPARVAVLFLLLFISYFFSSTWQGLQHLVSQQLVGKAFAQSIASGERQKPWFWSDTWPVVSLSFPERQELLYVLAGAELEVLRHGPGHVLNSAFPGQVGNALIQSHGDGYFDFLPTMTEGELIEVESQYGRTLFRVTSTRITSDSPQELAGSGVDRELTLITPYQSQSQAQAFYFVVNAVAVTAGP
ncbi:MAG: sortase domain-bontaining protein [Aestuariibacter sp.]